MPLQGKKESKKKQIFLSNSIFNCGFFGFYARIQLRHGLLDTQEGPGAQTAGHGAGYSGDFLKLLFRQAAEHVVDLSAFREIVADSDPDPGPIRTFKAVFYVFETV